MRAQASSKHNFLKMLSSTGRKEALHVTCSYLTIEKEEDFILFHA